MQAAGATADTCGALHGSRAANLNGKPHIFHGNTWQSPCSQKGANDGLFSACSWTALNVSESVMDHFTHPSALVRCVYKSRHSVIQQNIPDNTRTFIALPF